MNKRILSLCLVLILIISTFPFTNIYATEERWIDVTIGEIYTANNILDEDYNDGNNVVRYYVYPDFNYGTNYGFVATFNERYLDNLFPHTSITGQRMKLKVEFNGINQTSKTIWQVLDYEYFEEELNSNLLNVEVLKEYFRHNERCYYYVQNIETKKIFLVDFPDGLSEQLYKSIGSQISVYYTGEPYLFHGKTTYTGTKFIPYQSDKTNPNLYNPEIKEYIGTLKEIYLFEQKEDKISYILEDISKEKDYIAFFDIGNEDYAELHSFVEMTNDEYNSKTGLEDNKFQLTDEYFEEINEYQLGRKIKIYGYIEGKENEKEIIIVKDYIFIDDNYTKYDKENVYLTGTIETNLKNEKNQTIYSMKSEDQTKSEYLLIFDESVLLNQMPTISLLGKKLSIYGVVNKVGDTYYVGVLSYGIIEETAENGEEYSSSYSIKEVSFSRIIEETNEYISYYGIDNNNKKETYVFSKEALGYNMPTHSLTNKSFTIAYIPQNNSNYVLAWDEIVKDNQAYYEKGILLKRINRNYTSSEYIFQNSYGEQLIAIIPIELENQFLTQKEIDQNIGLKNETVYIFGNISTYDGSRRLIVKDMEKTSELYINKSTADVITFSGTITDLVSEKTTGIMYYIQNEYDQNVVIYFDKDTLGDAFPNTSLLGQKMTVRGIKYSNGILLITDFNNQVANLQYPVEPEKKYTNPIDFPNMKGFTGIISILNIDKTYYTLTTSKSRYILLFEDQEIEKLLQLNLNNTVYLRGQPDVMGNSFWSNRIKVYDLQPLCLGNNKCTTIISPVNTEIPEYKPDPQKNAIHTIQINEADPKKYEFGKGILESLYIPSNNIDEIIKNK